MKARFDGLDDYMIALKTMALGLQKDAEVIVLQYAEGAKQEIQSAYPASAASLAAAMTLTKVTTGPRAGIAVDVVNTHDLAYIYERGTVARHTALGHDRGIMPPAHIFEPRYLRWNAAMYEALKRMLDEHGLRVTGDAAA